MRKQVVYIREFSNATQLQASNVSPHVATRVNRKYLANSRLGSVSTLPRTACYRVL
jgi:hypothetical protein